MALQTARPIALKTPLGEDVLLLRSMTGSEHMGRLSQFELSVASTDEAIKMDDLLGKVVTVELELDGKQRFFNGYVSRFAQTGRTEGYATYQVTVVPWLWFLTRKQDCRIFQEMTAPDIVKKVFQDYSFADFKAALSGSYRTRGYCVQYRETDFDFVSRLMEEEGIYYFFTHEDGKHTLHLADAYGAHSPIQGNEQVPYYPPTENAVHKEEHIHDWAVTKEVMPGQVSLQDYDFWKPGVDLATRSKAKRDHALADFEMYDYPGKYYKEDDGKSYARTRLEEYQSQHEQVHGAGNRLGLEPGGLFSLTGYPREDQNREYLIVSATYEMSSPEYESGGSDEGPRYACRFSAIESKTPYRTPRFTPRPVVQGPQTALVVGKSGEEIWTDKYGRIKVQFYWDRQGKKDENSSCWVRVASVWAGKQWGGIQIPRIGQEVVVDFLEGDPDRPLVTGRVYNADQMPPYDLPANATQSGVKSRSSKGGSTDNFNEIRMEDKKGSEELYLHAEKDHTNITENDRNEDVGHDRTLHVKHDKSEKIDNNKTITVAVNHKETIGGNKTLSVGGNHQESVSSNMSVTVGGNLSENVGIAYAENVGAAMALNVGAALAIDVGGLMSTNVGGGKTVSVGGANSINVGKDDSETIAGAKSVSISKDLSETIDGKHSSEVAEAYSLSAKSIQLKAEDEITVVTGDASISMKKDGTITIKGKDVTVQGSGKINVKADSDLVLKGSKIAGN